jgi:hypothetical protein
VTTIIVSFSLGDLKENEKNMSTIMESDQHMGVPFYGFLQRAAALSAHEQQRTADRIGRPTTWSCATAVFSKAKGIFMSPQVIQASKFFPQSHHVIQVLHQNICIYMSQKIAMIYLQSGNV